MSMKMSITVKIMKSPTPRKSSTPSKLMWQKMKRVSGRDIGKHATKMIACTSCNFMEIYNKDVHAKKPKASNQKRHNKSVSASGPLALPDLHLHLYDNLDAQDAPVLSYQNLTPLKTGSQCPRCGVKTIRIFDSRAEFTRSRELKLMEERGEINSLEYQAKFDLHTTSITGKKVKLYAYVADFTYWEHDKDDPSIEKFIVEDVKNSAGVISDVAAMKMKHFEAEYDSEVRIVLR